MSKKTHQFDASAKARIMRSETAKQGHVPSGSFGSDVQSVVDQTETKPILPTKTATKPKK